MRGLLLIALLAVIISIGYFLMRRLDRILEESRRPEELPCPAKPDSLRIGLLNPTAADGITELLHLYAQRYPNVVVSLSYGAESELIRQLSHDNLDMVLVSECGEAASEVRAERGEVLSAAPVGLLCGNSKEQPGTAERELQQIVWKKAVKNPAVSSFLECLQTEKGTL